jgi:lauroyl/myristoyl acyltransferase
MIIIVKLLQFIFRIIFFLPAGAALALMRGAAGLTQAAAKRRKLKKIVEQDIRLMFPQIDCVRAADRLIANTSRTLFEVLCTPFFKKKHYHAVFKWQGLDILDRALQEKKGAIILTMHAGNYEGIVPALSNLGYKINAVLRATDDPLFAVVNRSRSARGANLINVLEKDMYRETLKCLKNNELVFLLADTGALESRHELREFLGKKVPVATGWLTLAQRADCPVIPSLSKREGRSNLITLHQPIRVTKDQREEALQKAGRVFEDFIRQNPDHWGIFLNAYETERMVKGG